MRYVTMFPQGVTARTINGVRYVGPAWWVDIQGVETRGTNTVQIHLDDWAIDFADLWR